MDKVIIAVFIVASIICMAILTCGNYLIRIRNALEKRGCKLDVIKPLDNFRDAGNAYVITFLDERANRTKRPASPNAGAGYGSKTTHNFTIQVEKKCLKQKT